MDETLTAKVQDVDPPYARHLRDTCNFDRQRAINDINRQRLAVEMIYGRFIPGTTVYFAVLPNGKMLILNGNHTLEAIVASGKTQRLVFIFKQVADVSEAARLYGTFDIHKARTWTDALKAVNPDKKFPMSNAVMPAVGHIMQRFDYNPRNVEANNSRGARFASMHDYEEPAASLQAVMVGAPGVNKAAIKRKGVLAVALETVRYQPGPASVFWKDLAHDDGLPNGDARKTLLRWLLNSRSGGAKLIGASAANSHGRAAIGAWNAWYRGDALQSLRPHTGPIVILGTPWDGKYDDPLSDDGPNDGPNAPGGNLTDLFETGVRVTQGGNEPVVLYRKAKG
jgi:hypothetical protein